MIYSIIKKTFPSNLIMIWMDPCLKHGKYIRGIRLNHIKLMYDINKFNVNRWKLYKNRGKCKQLYDTSGFQMRKFYCLKDVCKCGWQRERECDLCGSFSDSKQRNMVKTSQNSSSTTSTVLGRLMTHKKKVGPVKGDNWSSKTGIYS